MTRPESLNFVWQIPRTGQAEPLEVPLHDGEAVLVVGPNGAGKSALLQNLVLACQARVRWITAQRQNWLDKDGIDLTPSARAQFESLSGAFLRQASSRWTDNQSKQRLSAVLFDLVAAETHRAREIANLIDAGRTNVAEEKSRETQSPFQSINRLLALGSPSISITSSNRGEILATHPDSEPFSLAQMSDGERNAVIIAAHVLTVESKTILVTDEPERHLNTAIVRPFLGALISARPDCTFVIATHELSLSLALPDAQVLMPQSCEWENDLPIAWEIRSSQAGTNLPEDLKLAVLGSRDRVLFVEGENTSLDLPIYRSLFPGVTVTPKGGCAEVGKAVSGLRETSLHHHVAAFGLIDKDDRTEEQCRELARAGVFALEAYSAESLYYCDDSIAAVANRQAESLGLNAEQLISEAKSRAIEVLRDEETRSRLCARRCQSIARSRVMQQLPSWRDIQACDPVRIEVPTGEMYQEEINRMESLVENNSWEAVCSRYPVRESQALDVIASALRCPSREQYQLMVIARIAANSSFADALRAKVGSLAAGLSA